VEWPAGDSESDEVIAQEESDESCYAVSLASADHWALADVVALVETGAKEVSSLDGHRRATTSPHFAKRLGLLDARLRQVREAIRERDMEKLGEVLEEDAIELHLVAMSSRPAIFYWKPGTLAVLEAVRDLRRQGLPAYSTMDAGANVHVICPQDVASQVADQLEAVDGVHEVLRDRVGDGPRFLDAGLF